MLSAGRKYIVFLPIALIAVVIACTPTARHGVLKTLFDGVPEKNFNSNLTVGLDTIGALDSARVLAIGAALKTNKYEYHEPYLNKECSSCHSEQHMGQLVMEEPGLCFKCHTEQEEMATIKHGPAGAGYCTSCHRPHMAEENNLLTNAGAKLCFNCHNEESITNNAIHQQTKRNQQCIECHDPHSSENNFLLAPGTCFSCHEESIKDYSFLHGPVASDLCSTCHTSHTSGKENLLISASPELCINCHSERILKLIPKHQEDANKNCLQCHNPHGGENQFMLN